MTSVAQLNAFAKQWNLNSDATAKLLSLSPEALDTVVRDFKGRPHDDNTGRCISFANSVEKTLKAAGHAGTPVSDEEAQAFISGFALNADAQRKLWSLPSDVRTLALVDFNPPPTATEFSGLFIAFSNSLQKATQKSKTAGGSVPQARGDPLPLFCQRWGLNADAQSKLRSLPKQLQEMAIRDFSPPAGLENSGRFIAFAVSMEKNHGVRAATRTAERPQARSLALNVFCKQWSLNGDAQKKLWSLHPTLQDMVLSDFNPPKSGECNGRFIAFAASLEKRHGLYGKPVAPVPAPVMPRVPAARLSSPPQQHSAGEDVSQTDEEREAALIAFCERYGLDVDTQQLLWDQSPHTQDSLIHRFESEMPDGATVTLEDFQFLVSEVEAESALGNGSGANGKHSHDDSRLSAFVEKWRLNSDAEAKLYSVPREVQERLLAEFKHNFGEGADCSGRFIAFAVSLAKRMCGPGAHAAAQLGGGPNEGVVDLFCEQYSLNEDARRKLLSLHDDVLAAVVSEYNPPEGTSEHNGKLISFANSVEKNSGKRGGPRNSQDEARAASLVAFCEQWELNEDAQTKLFSLSPEVQDKVIVDFAPDVSKLTGNPSGMFIKFASGVSRRCSSDMSSRDQVLLGFCQHWGLNEDAQAKLCSVPPEVQDELMVDFNPGDAQLLGNCSGKFIAFTVSVEKRLGLGRYAGMRDTTSAGALAAFIQKYDLNSDAQERLYGLRPDIQQVVMDEYAPTPDQWEHNGKIIKFASSVEKRMKSQAPGPHRQSAAATSDVAAFIRQYNLNADAQARLQGLKPDVLAAVIAGYSPPPDQRDHNGKVIMFSSSVEKRMWLEQKSQASAHGAAPGTSLPAFIQKWSLNSDAQQRLQGLKPEVLAVVMDEYAPSPDQWEHNGKVIMFAASVEKRMAKLLSQQAAGPGHDRSASRTPIILGFCHHWGLNEDAQAKLQSVPADLQDKLMAEFAPSDPEILAGCSGKFIAFTNSMAKRLGVALQAPKRPAATNPAPPPAAKRLHSGGVVQQSAVAQLREWSDASLSGAVTHSSTAYTADPQAEWKIAEFVQHWNINADGVGKLQRLSPPALQKVLQTFNPGEAGSNDWTGKLISYTNRVEAEVSADPIAAFVARWNLNGDAQHSLMRLSMHKLDIVLSEFRPPSESTDVNGLLIKFAASVHKRGP
eukprot:TRINITY_DN33006_c0_g2_i1.p1 TRINITY_DN33006_c0_g2~~TRINITY_DN33006_c0_g2_i1.p1  ORF type:complete len:1172 (-),score=262.45 TRINITY_DN33006_c0_g2_i1:28-3543(-)